MSKKNLFQLKDLALAIGPILLVVFLIGYFGYKYVDPAPPRHFVMSTGEEGGNYQTYALRYKEIIKKEGGVELEVRTSKGAWDNLHFLEDKQSGIDAGFVQDGLGDPKNTPDVSSLGSLFYEPIWVFYRGKTEWTRLTHLIGKKVGMGAMGGETHTMAKKLLNASGVDDKNTKLFSISMEEEFEKLNSGELDAGFFVADADNPLVSKLLRSPTIHLMSMDQADGITRQFRYLHHLTLPHGSIDLKQNIPSKDIDLVSPTATMVVRNSLHPAVVYLLLKAMSKVHYLPGVFEEKNEFPIDKNFVFPLNTEAKEYFKTGAPFWLRYLPFWLATIVERLVYIVLPLLAVVLPMVRAVPRFLDWRVKNRIFQRYGELRGLENQIVPDSAQEKYETYLAQLEKIEDRVNGMKLPLGVADDVYLLREHIHFVRERLNRLLKASEKRRPKDLEA